MQAWDLLEPEAPGGTRDPVVLHSTDEARAVLVVLNPGQQLGDHEVKEHAWLAVVDGRVAGRRRRRDAARRARARSSASSPSERHSVASEDGARILLLLAPWPARATSAAAPTRRVAAGCLRGLALLRVASRPASPASACVRAVGDAVHQVAERDEEREQDEHVQDDPVERQAAVQEVDERGDRGREEEPATGGATP